MNRKQAILAGSYEERQERRAQAKTRKDQLALLKADKDAAQKRAREERKKREEQKTLNALRGTQVQEITKTAKLKKMSKKHRQQYVRQADLIRRLGKGSI